MKINDLTLENQFARRQEVLEISKPTTIQESLKDLIKKAKKTPAAQRSTRRKVEDPREGISRRFANYIPIKRYQYVGISD